MRGWQTVDEADSVMTRDRPKIGVEGMLHIRVFWQFQRYDDVVVLQVQLVEAYRVG